MTKQEQIEEMRREIYYARSKVNGIATSNDIAEALYDAGYRKIDGLKAENARLKEEVREFEVELNARLTCDFVRTAQKHAVQDFADKLKTQFEEKEQHYICMYDWNAHSAVTDCENEVDELLKEYE